MQDMIVKYEKIKDKEHEFTFGYVNDNIITINEILNEKQQRVVEAKLLGFIKLYQPQLKTFGLTMHETDPKLLEIEEELNKFAQEYLKEGKKIMIKKLQALGFTTKQDKNTVTLFIDEIKVSIIHGKNKKELNEKLEKLFEDKERLTLFASYISKFLKDKKTDWISAIYNSYGKKMLISTVPENNENIEEISYTIKFKDNNVIVG